MLQTHQHPDPSERASVATVAILLNCLEYADNSCFVAVQLQEELRAARQDASHQHVRELKLDLKTAQLTSAALQKQVRQCHNIYAVLTNLQVSIPDASNAKICLNTQEAKYTSTKTSQSITCLLHQLRSLR